MTKLTSNQIDELVEMELDGMDMEELREFARYYIAKDFHAAPMQELVAVYNQFILNSKGE